MPDEQWERVQSLYHQALQLSSEERKAYLTNACGGDHEVQREIEDLLRAAGHDSGFVEKLVGDAALQLVAVPQRPPLTIGTRLAHYEITAHLGSGGMGDVYQASDTKLNRRVALKVLPTATAGQAEARKRFEREAKAVAALNHPNIVTIYSVEDEGGVVFLTMELIDGKTLSDLIPKGGMRLERILKLAIPLVDAVSSAHRQGITHRDLKPANIMVTDDGRVKVLDFGLAKLREEQKASAETATDPTRGLTGKGSILGTTMYMSPEQAEGRSVDARSDIFSLGIILYEMATGRLPFHGETDIAVLSSILKDNPPPITELNNEQPRDLARIVKRCLAKDPEQRYQSGKDLRIELEELKEAADSGVIQTVSPQPLARGGNARRWKFAFAGSVAVGLIAVAFGVLHSRQVSPTATVPAAPQIELTRLTSSGKAGLAAISPDGKYVVHVVVEPAQQSLWMRQVATSSNVLIVPPSPVRYDGLTFSPDGNFVYYSTYPQAGTLATLYTIPVLGGTPRPLLEDVDSSISFSADGRHFVVVRGIPDTGETVLLIARPDGTLEKTLVTTKQPTNFGDNNPAWSPDGKTIAMAANGVDGGGPFMHVVAIDVATGAVRPVGTRHWRSVGSVVWAPGGHSLLFTATDTADSLALITSPGQVWQLSFPSGTAQKITNDLNSYSDVSLAADGRSLVATQSELVAHLWVAPVGGDSTTARQITNGRSSDGAMGLAWTPDGRIIYASEVSGSSDLWIVDADAENGKPLPTGGAPNIFPRVSPDGRHLIFQSGRDGNIRIWRTDIDGGNPQPLSPGPIDTAALFMPDGNFVLYTTIASRPQTIWKVPVGGGSRERITSSEPVTWALAVSPDAKQLVEAFYPQEQHTGRLGIRPLESDAAPVPLDIVVPVVMNFWIPPVYFMDGKNVTFVDPKLTNVFVMQLDGDKRRPITKFAADTIFSYALSPDGKRIALSRGTISTDVVLMTHLPAS
jgi:serine/threonine protein kinase/Tol biopolymer transport system component